MSRQKKTENELSPDVSDVNSVKVVRYGSDEATANQFVLFWKTPCERGGVSSPLEPPENPGMGRVLTVTELVK